MKKVFFIIAAFAATFVTFGNVLHAGLLATGQATGTIVLFDENTFAQSTFAQISLGGVGSSLSGIAYGNNRIYVSELNQNGAVGGRIHMFDLAGNSLGVKQLSAIEQPGGIAVRSNGNVYVSNIFANAITIFNPTLTDVTGGIAGVGAGSTAGIGFLSNGDTIVSTIGGGLFRYNGVTVSTFSSNSGPAGQIAVDSDDNVYAGHGLGFDSRVYKFDSIGNEIGVGGILLSITDADLNNVPSIGGAFGTNPAGVVFDANGDLFVGALGRSSIADGGSARGGVFKYNSTGLQLARLTPDVDGFAMSFSSLAIAPVAVPEPGTVALIALGGVVTTLVRRRRRARALV